MSAGLFGLLDDIAALAKLAAASIDDVGAATGRAGVKAAGVVVDDTAVTPQYVRHIAARRELPVVARIARGSLRNKLLIILPGALLLSHYLPGAIIVVLLLGGSYLGYEGAERVWSRLGGGEHPAADPTGPVGPDASAGVPGVPGIEEQTVSGAIRTDFILSTEIMVIALGEVTDEAFWLRAAVLVAVAFGITALVYGAVAVIVKMDDVGLALARRGGTLSRRVGRGLVGAMPVVLATLTVVGIAAMLWVGGHIVLTALADLGITAPLALVAAAGAGLADLTGATGIPGVLLTTLSGTVLSALAGFAWGSLLLAALRLPQRWWATRRLNRR